MLAKYLVEGETKVRWESKEEEKERGKTERAVEEVDAVGGFELLWPASVYGRLAKDAWGVHDTDNTLQTYRTPTSLGVPFSRKDIPLSVTQRESTALLDHVSRIYLPAELSVTLPVSAKLQVLLADLSLRGLWHGELWLMFPR